MKILFKSHRHSFILIHSLFSTSALAVFLSPRVPALQPDDRRRTPPAPGTRGGYVVKIFVPK